MKRFITILICVVAAGLLGTVAVATLSTGVPVETAIVERGTIRVYVEERGKTRVQDIFRLTMPLDGRIQRITLTEGDMVSKGDVVASLDTADLETDLAESTARVGQFEQLLLSLVGTVKAAEAQRDARLEQFKLYDSEFKRIRSLAETEVATQSELERAQSKKLESGFNVQEEKFTIQSYRSIQAAIGIAKEDADNQRNRRQRDRNRAALHSPVDGVVLRRHVSNERVLQAGEPLLEIGRLSDLEIGVDILTQDVVTIELGDSVDIEGPAIGDEPLRGSVVKIYPQGFTKISSLGVEQQRVKVIIHFDPEELDKLKKRGRTLKVDYRVHVKIYTDERTDQLIIPRFAVFRGTGGNWHTLAVRDGKARLVELQVGLMNDFEVEVLDGLQAGERVVIAPESSLTDGTRVEQR